MARTVRFLRDTDPTREGGPGFKAGEVHTLREGAAKRWVVRSAAEYVESPKEQLQKAVAEEALEQLKEISGVSLDSPPDVGGQDDRDSGERAEPDAGSVPTRRRGRPPKAGH